MPKNKIASELHQGWQGSRSNQSIKALKWLACQEHQLRLQHPTNGDRIRTVSNRGEVRLFDRYHPQSRHSMTYRVRVPGVPFFPIHHNRHPICHHDHTMHKVYEATLKRQETLRQRGCAVKVMWECAWDHEVKTNPELRQFVGMLKIVDPLQPRDAFFGGRTNAIKLHNVADQDEEIECIDVTSLYLWVNKTQEYPVAHPEAIVNPNDQDIRHYFGMAKVDILPPYELYHPVLPHKHKGKLTFPLCQACKEEEMAKPLLEKSCLCRHTSEQHTLRGTLCTPEIQMAVEPGYTLVKFHEVHHFPPNQKGLFADYVNTWLKIKQESAGYSPWAITPQTNPSTYGYTSRKKASTSTPSSSSRTLHKTTNEAVHQAHHLFALVSNPLNDIRQVRLPRLTQAILVPGRASTTRAQLRHGLRHLHHQTRATAHLSKRLPGRDDERTRGRHHRIHVRGS